MPPLPGGLQIPAAGRGGGPAGNPATNPHASLLQALSASGIDHSGLKQQMQQMQQQQQQQQQQQRAPSIPGVATAPPPQPFPGGFPAAGFGMFSLLFPRLISVTLGGFPVDGVFSSRSLIINTYDISI